YAIRECVECKQLLRILQRVGERVDEKPRAFGDEFAVQLLALAYVPDIELTSRERLLGDPGGGHRRRSPHERPQDAGHGADEIRVHGYPVRFPVASRSQTMDSSSSRPDANSHC